MKKEIEKVTTDRRGFLKMAGLGSVAGTGALVAGGQAKADDVNPENGQLGYRETEHVKTFYKSARF